MTPPRALLHLSPDGQQLLGAWVSYKGVLLRHYAAGDETGAEDYAASVLEGRQWDEAVETLPESRPGRAWWESVEQLENESAEELYNRVQLELFAK